MSAWLDDREHGLRRLLSADLFNTKHMDVGDIWIGAELPNSLLIERKAAADLEASILDGRYREQRSRLLATSTETKAHPVYIIEGDLDRLGARLSKSALMKHLTRLALRYHVTVFQTSCLEETAELLKLLADQWTTDPTTFEQPATLTYIETRGTSRQANSDDPRTFAVGVLSCCRGVSAAGAAALLDKFGGTLAGVWAASAEELAAVQVGKQKFGKAKADRLYSLLHNSATP